MQNLSRFSSPVAWVLAREASPLERGHMPNSSRFLMIVISRYCREERVSLTASDVAADDVATSIDAERSGQARARNVDGCVVVIASPQEAVRSLRHVSIDADDLAAGIHVPGIGRAAVRHLEGAEHAIHDQV